MRYFFMKKDIITSFFLTEMIIIISYALFLILSLTGVIDELSAV